MRGRGSLRRWNATPQTVASITPLPRLVNEGFIHHGFSRRSPCAALLEAMQKLLRYYDKSSDNERDIVLGMLALGALTDFDVEWNSAIHTIASARSTSSRSKRAV